MPSHRTSKLLNLISATSCDPKKFFRPVWPLQNASVTGKMRRTRAFLCISPRSFRRTKRGSVSVMGSRISRNARPVGFVSSAPIGSVTYKEKAGG